jgi:hypothetical protein
VVVRDWGTGLAARVRAEPSRGSAILVRAKPGDTVELLGTVEGEAIEGDPRWLRVKRGDVVGWVWAPLVEGRETPESQAAACLGPAD